MNHISQYKTHQFICNSWNEDFSFFFFFFSVSRISNDLDKCPREPWSQGKGREKHLFLVGKFQKSFSQFSLESKDYYGHTIKNSLYISMVIVSQPKFRLDSPQISPDNKGNWSHWGLPLWGGERSQFDQPQAVDLEKAMATHSSTLAWKIPCTEEPGRLQSIGSRRVGHD